MAVIIPVRDTVQWRDSVSAVLAGTRQADELVVVDDGSVPPIESPSGAGSPIRLIRQAPSGPAVARNAGVGATTGEVLVFVDADVTVSEDTLAELERRLQAAPADVAAIQTVYAPYSPDSGFASTFQALLQSYNFQSVPDDTRFEGLSSFCVAIRRDAFLTVGGFDEEVARATVEDDTLGVKLTRAGFRILLARDLHVVHHARYTCRGLLARMYRMASDKVRSVRRSPFIANTNLRQSHHRPEFIASVLCISGAIFAIPVAPVCSVWLLGAATALQSPFVLFAFRRQGVGFAATSAVMMLGLAGAAALGCVTGLLD